MDAGWQCASGDNAVTQLLLAHKKDSTIESEVSKAADTHRLLQLSFLIQYGHTELYLPSSWTDTIAGSEKVASVRLVRANYDGIWFDSIPNWMEWGLTGSLGGPRGGKMHDVASMISAITAMRPIAMKKTRSLKGHRARSRSD